MLGPDDKPVPFQIHDGVLSFVAALANGQSVAYKLSSSPSDHSAGNSKLTTRREGRMLQIANALFAARVPEAQEKTFKTPVAVNEVPAPLLGVKQAGQDWCGSSHFFTERKVAAVPVLAVGDRQNEQAVAEVNGPLNAPRLVPLRAAAGRGTKCRSVIRPTFQPNQK